MDSRLQLIFAAKNLASGEIGRLHGQLIRLRGGLGGIAGGARSAVGGLASLAGTAMKLATGGLAALIAGLGFATKEAADEDVGLRRLDAALKANIKGWKGNTDAIEKQIAAQERLGFSDNEQRDSLAKLIAKFRDVAKAQQIQTVAMDVARLRGISLAEASELVGKGVQGNTKVLKQLGIQLPKTATEQQRLAAIQKRAAGQAEEYGESSKNAYESFKIALGDLVEDVGRSFLPVMTQVFTFLRDQGLPAVRGVIGAVQTWVAENQPLIHQIADFARGALTTLFNVVGTVVGAIAGKGKGGGKSFIESVVELGSKIFTFVVPKIQSFVDNLVKPGGVVDSIAKVVGPILKDLIPALGGIITAIFGGKGTRGLIPALGDLIGKVWGDGNGPLAVALKGIAGVFTWFLTNVVKPITEAIAFLIDRISDAIALLDKLAGKHPVNKIEGVMHGGQGGSGGISSGKARGGPVIQGIPFTYAEHGTPESWMFPTGRGRVLADGGFNARQAAGSMTRIIQLVVDKRVLAEVVDEDDYWSLAAAGTSPVRS